MKDPSIFLTLYPIDAQSGMEAVIVNSFPFLIGRDEGFFPESEKGFASPIMMLSHKHAQIFFENGTFFLQDFGSKNGTILSGQKITDQPYPLRDGDIVTFAKVFSYKVELNQPDETTEAENFSGSKTVSFSSPMSFLKVLSHHTEKGNSDRTSDVTNALNEPMQNKNKPFFKGILEQFPLTSELNKKRNWYILSLVCLLLISLLSWVLITKSPERKLQKLLNQGQYTKCLAVANVMLSNDPNNDNLQQLATEALIKTITSDWIPKLDNSLFSDAHKILAESASRCKHLPYGQKVIGLLNWITDLSQYVSAKNTETQLVIFKDELQIESLADWWETNKTENHRLLEELARRNTSFTSIRERLFSQLNRVRATMALHLPAIKELKDIIQRELDTDQPHALVPVLEEFAEQFPEIGGIAFLRNDLNNYISLGKAIDAKQLLEISRILTDSPFQTQPFIDKVTDLRNNILPSQQVIKRYLRAAEIWSSGDGQSAIAILEPLIQEKWGQLAMRRVDRYRNILKELSLLENARGTAAFDKLLLSLHGSLNPESDSVYLKVLEKDFVKIRERELIRANALFVSADQSWNAYNHNGRINGIIRLENNLSNEFRQQAQRLVSSMEKASSGIKIHNQLGQIPPTSLITLEEQTRNELDMQMMLLNDLHRIMDPLLLEDKLRLLTPLPSGDAP